MSKLLRRAFALMAIFGFDPKMTIASIKGLPSYFRDLGTLKRQRAFAAQDFPFGKPYPCLADRYGSSGSVGGHYFYQDLLVARRIYSDRPRHHVDVGSRIDGFVAHVAVFREIDVIDVRPLSQKIPNVRFMQADLMENLPAELHDSCDSLSCLHAIEHFGLGRYGDPVQYDGYLKGMANLYLMLCAGGKLYFSVPIGPQRIEFNAHRVFSVAYLLDCFSGKYRIDRFSFIDDCGDLHEDVALEGRAVLSNFGCVHGCGIFELTKI